MTCLLMVAFDIAGIAAKFVSMTLPELNVFTVAEANRLTATERIERVNEELANSDWRRLPDARGGVEVYAKNEGTTRDASVRPGVMGGAATELWVDRFASSVAGVRSVSSRARVWVCVCVGGCAGVRVCVCMSGTELVSS